MINDSNPGRQAHCGILRTIKFGKRRAGGEGGGEIGRRRDSINWSTV